MEENKEFLIGILTDSNLASSNTRRDLLSKIPVREDFDGNNIDNYSDRTFSNKLINFLIRTKQKGLLIKLCYIIKEEAIKDGSHNAMLTSIIRQNIVNEIVSKCGDQNFKKQLINAYKKAIFLAPHTNLTNKHTEKEISYNTDNSDLERLINLLDKDQYCIPNDINNCKSLDILFYFLSKQLHENEEANQDILKLIKCALPLDLQYKRIREESVDCSLLIMIGEGNSLIFKASIINSCHIKLENNQEKMIYQSKKDVHNIELNKIIANLTWDNLPDKMNDILNYIITDNNIITEISKIEFFIPYKRFQLIHQWLIEREGEKYYFGSYYEIKIRIIERIKKPNSADDKTSQDRWMKKCHSLKSHTYSNFEDIFYTMSLEQTSKELKNECRKDNVLAAKPNRSIKNGETNRMIEVLYFTGVPLAIWVQDIIDSETYTSQLNDIISQASCPSSISKLVRTKLKEADTQRNKEDIDHIGKYLCLIWDDYYSGDYNRYHNTLSMP